MSETVSEAVQSALKTFNLEAFRTGQQDVIESIVRGEDLLCVMPTGGGKSLCYQLPSVIRPGLTIVVSPLIALMKDQVDRLGQLGISAALLNSTLSHSEQESRLTDIARGKYKMVYVAPERLRNPRFQEAIRSTPIQLLAIDEAHCISQWGHDFRPDYTRIGQFREWLGGIQTVALTATATPRVREDIVAVLGLKRPKQFMSGFARPNLHFGVVTCQSDREKDDQLLRFLAKDRGSGIIYCATRKRCDELVEAIGKKTKLRVGAYHAGLMPDGRRQIQERFMRNEIKIVVATNAFGMGIDKADLRFVIHYNMPGSLEAYYQEAGRAGRDGKHSQCVMLYSYQDRYIQDFFIDNNYPSRQVMQAVYEFLLEREEDPIELTQEEIRDALGLSVSPEAIGSSLQVLARTGVLQRLERGTGMAVVRIDSNLPTTLDMLPREAKVRRIVLRLLERAVGDRRYESVTIHPRWLLQESGLKRETVTRALRELSKLEPIDYVPPFRGRAVHFKRRGVAFDDLGIDFQALQKRKAAEIERLENVVKFAQSPLCRQKTILNYFGDPNPENCEQCDRCGRRAGWPVFNVGQQEADAKGEEPKSADGRAAEQSSHQAAPAASSPASSSPVQASCLAAIMDAIGRIHGRLGKHLIAQYLCGSQNAKVQKLHLHRLSGFGMLKGFRQADAVVLVEHLLAAGALVQQEVNRNRPTISVSPQLTDEALRLEVLAGVQLPDKLAAKLLSAVGSRVRVSQQGSAHSSQGSAHSSQGSMQQNVGGPTSAAGSPSVTSRPALQASEPPQTRESPDEVASAKALQLESDFSASGEVQRASQMVGSDAKPSNSAESELFGEKQSSAPAAPMQDKKPESPAGSAGHTRELPKHDWQWSVRLFKDGFRWHEVEQVRRMDDLQVAASLTQALDAGVKIPREWIASDSDGELSTGQRRLLRHIQRRSAAGLS